MIAIFTDVTMLAIFTNVTVMAKFTDVTLMVISADVTMTYGLLLNTHNAKKTMACNVWLLVVHFPTQYCIEVHSTR